MKRTTRFGTAVTAAVLAASLAGCGGSDFAKQSVSQIKKQTDADMKTAKSLTIEGSVNESGTDLQMKLAVDRDGNCSGSIGTADAKAEILGIGSASYIKGDEAFWKLTAGASAAMVSRLVGDKWAKLPANSASFSSFCDLDNLLKDVGKGSKTKDTVGKTTTIDGQKAVEVDSTGPDGTTQYWVATEGKHYFLKVSKAGTGGGTFTLTDYNVPVKATAPPASDVVDLSALG